MSAPAFMPARGDVDAEFDTRFAEIVDELTRRGLLGAGVGAAALIGLAACGSSETQAPKADGSGSWSYTDDHGSTVRLNQRPRRVAFLCDTVAAELWAAGVRPVASTFDAGGVLQAVAMTDRGFRVIGSGIQGELNLEELAAAQPDLLVDALFTYTADGKTTTVLQTVRDQPALTKIAPVVGMNVQRSVEAVIASADRLAGALGAPASADAAAKARYDRATAAVRAAASGNPGVRVGFVFMTGDTGVDLMSATQNAYPHMQTLRRLGVDLPAVEGDSQLYSWETVPDLPVDLVVWADSGHQPPTSNAGWEAMPAVRAGQVWVPHPLSLYSYSWNVFASFFAQLAQHIAAATPGIGAR